MAEAEGNEDRSEAAVVVLGDVGRSPRMCNHAKMLADEGYDVKLIGFDDSSPHDVIRCHPRIKIVGTPPPPELKFLPDGLQLPFKLVWNFYALFFTLLARTSNYNLRVILLQNPPAIPTMLICYIVAKFKCAKFSIDWHNYMYTILQDKYNLSDEQVLDKTNKSKKAKIVRLVSILEGLCGKLSDYNLCVTDAMRADLARRWRITASTFYDRPPTWKFGETSLEEIHELYLKLSKTPEGEYLKGKTDNDTILTRRNSEGKVILQPERPLVLLSSTSWTPDEKFEILLDALVEYDSKNHPKVLMIITGKGPLKAMYLEQIEEKKLRNVTVLTPWLEAEDYPRILASADLGISLHTSTSGLDLPMKVVDMFGANVPVLAKKFPCIHELVKENTNGYLFEDSEQLARQISELSRGFPSNCKELERLKRNVRSADFESWETMWHRSAAPAAGLNYANDEAVRLRAIVQLSSIAVVILIFVHYMMGSFIGLF